MRIRHRRDKPVEPEDPIEPPFELDDFMRPYLTPQEQLPSRLRALRARLEGAQKAS